MIEVASCHRCGNDHLLFAGKIKRLANPIVCECGKAYTHYSHCPITNEPMIGGAPEIHRPTQRHEFTRSPFTTLVVHQ